MLRKVEVRNFKMFEERTFDLPKHLVVVGPNNGGKTSPITGSRPIPISRGGMTATIPRPTSTCADSMPCLWRTFRICGVASE